MPKRLEDIRDDLLKLATLPEGYSITCDHKTDNLLVNGPTLSFCITRHAIDDNFHISMYPPSLEALIAAEKFGADFVDLPPIPTPKIFGKPIWEKDT